MIEIISSIKRHIGKKEYIITNIISEGIILKCPDIKLLSKRLALREFAYMDWIDVHKYASQDIVCQYQPWGPNTEEDSRNFVIQVIQDSSQEPRRRFAFAITYNENMIGTIELNIRDITNREGEISYIINPDYWGQGIASEVTMLLIDFGFNILKLHRIYATCDPRNTGSSKVLAKVGMIREGRIRENLLIKDGWRDSLLHSVLEHEWKK